MPKFHEAKLIAEGKKFGLVVSRFNDFITEKLLSGALDALVRTGAADKDIEVVKVPGAFEIPLVTKKMANTKRFDAVICRQAVLALLGSVATPDDAVDFHHLGQFQRENAILFFRLK